MEIFGYVLFSLSFLSFTIFITLFLLTFQRKFKPLIPVNLHIVLLIGFLVLSAILLSVTTQILIKV